MKYNNELERMFDRPCYIVLIETENTIRKLLIFDESSAVKVAYEYGMREPGETVSVYSSERKLLTRAKWSGTKYYSCCT